MSSDIIVSDNKFFVHKSCPTALKSFSDKCIQTAVLVSKCTCTVQSNEITSDEFGETANDIYGLRSKVSIDK